MAAREKGYSPRTVIAAQRRVLKVAAAIIASLDERERTKLRAFGEHGLWTLEEVQHHAEEAAKLRVRYKP